MPTAGSPSSRNQAFNTCTVSGHSGTVRSLRPFLEDYLVRITPLPSPTPTPPPPGATACSQHIPATIIPMGFGSPFDVLSSPNTNLIQTSCDTSSVRIDLGTGDPWQYTYTTGYLYKTGQTNWSGVSYTSSESLIANAWYPKSADTTISMTSTWNSPTPATSWAICARGRERPGSAGVGIVSVCRVIGRYRVLVVQEKNNLEELASSPDLLAHSAPKEGRHDTNDASARPVDPMRVPASRLCVVHPSRGREPRASLLDGHAPAERPAAVHGLYARVLGAGRHLAGPQPGARRDRGAAAEVSAVGEG